MCCRGPSRCSVATTPRREVKREWRSARKNRLLIAMQVIRVVIHARMRSTPSMLGIVSPISLLLWLWLWQRAIHATHWVSPASSCSGWCLDAWQACNARQPAFALGTSTRVEFVCEGLARERGFHVLLPHLLKLLETCWSPGWHISCLALREILLLLLVSTFLTIPRGCVAWVGTGGRAISPRRIMRRAAIRNGVVEKGSGLAQASQNFRVVKGHEPKGRGKSLPIMDDAVRRGRARIRLLLRVIGS